MASAGAAHDGASIKTAVDSRIAAMQHYENDPELVAAQHELFDLSLAVVLSQCTNTAVSLGIPDVLVSAHGPLTPKEIIARLPDAGSMDAEALARVLGYLASAGIVEEAEYIGDDVSSGLQPTEARFGPTKKTQLLCQDIGGPSMRTFFQVHAGGDVFACHQQLAEALRQNKDAFSLVHGKSVWEFLEERPQLAQGFDLAMTDITQEALPAILRDYDGFPSSGTLVDVAGGQGLAAAAILSRCPDLRAVCFDLPRVVENTSPLPGVEYVAGDMFKALPKADAIFMKHILHDWNDEDSLRILASCRAALPVGGKLIIADSVTKPGSDKSARALRARMMDVHMLAMCVGGGKERNEGQWKALLQKAGFQLGRIVKTSAHLTDIIEAFKEEE